MKLEIESNNIISSPGSESVFTIEASPKAFQILSSRLYSNKYYCILRELGTNAYDSHVAAGCPEKPFDLHLPNRLNPELYVRDYGVGLAKEDVADIFCKFFFSNKIKSNDFEGCLGLGSKSPFAYTSQFIVETYQNGNKSVFSMFVRDGIPSTKLLAETTTDEPNGLKVIIAVKSEDHDDFLNECPNVFRFFKTKPNIINGPQIEKEEYELRGDSWALAKHGNAPLVVMGNCSYTIQTHELAKYSDCTEILLEDNLVLFCEVGEVDITPSRESLEFTNKTISALKEKVRKYTENLAKRINEEIDQFEYLYDVYKYILRSPMHEAIIHLSIIHKGVPLQAGCVNRAYYFSDFSMKYMDIISNDKCIHRTVKQIFLARGKRKSLFAINDTDKCIKSRVSSYIRKEGRNLFNDAYIIDSEHRNEVFTKLGLDDKHPSVIYGSDIPIIRAKPKSYDRKQFTNIFVYSYKHKSWRTDTDQSLDKNKEYLYVEVKNNKIVIDKENSIKFEDADAIMSLANFFGIETKNVIGIKTISLNKIVKSLGNRVASLIDCIRDNYVPDKYHKYLNQYYEIINNKSRYNSINNIATPKDEDNNPLLNLITNAKHVYTQYYEEVPMSSLRSTLSFFGYPPPIEKKPAFSIQKEFEKLEKKYPMLGISSWNINDKNLNTVLDYINLVDNRNS